MLSFERMIEVVCADENALERKCWFTDRASLLRLGESAFSSSYDQSNTSLSFQKADLHQLLSLLTRLGQRRGTCTLRSMMLALTLLSITNQLFLFYKQQTLYALQCYLIIASIAAQSSFSQKPPEIVFSVFTQCLQYVIKVNGMKKKIAKELFLQHVVKKYLRQSDVSLLTQALQQVSNHKNFNRLTATHLYKLFSSKSHQSKGLTLIQNLLQKSKTDQVQSLGYLIAHFAARTVAQLPNQALFNRIEETVHFGKLVPSQQRMLMTLLKVNYKGSRTPQHRVVNLVAEGANKPVLGHRELPSESIQKREASDLLKGYQQGQRQEWIKEVRRQTLLSQSSVQRRVLHQLLLTEENHCPQMTSLLPGRQCQSLDDLKSVITLLRELGRQAPYIDVFASLMTETQTKRDQICKIMIDYCFGIVLVGSRMVEEAHAIQITQRLHKMFSEQQKHNQITIFKTLVLVDELSRSSSLSPPVLKTIKQIQIVLGKQLIQKPIQRSSQLKDDQSGKLISNYMLLQLIKNLTKKTENVFTMQQLTKLITSMKTLLPSTAASQIIDFAAYAKAIKNYQPERAHQITLLYSEPVEETQLDTLLEPYFEAKELDQDAIKKTIETVTAQYKVLKNVVMQPNCQASYLVYSKSKQEYVAVVDLKKPLEWTYQNSPQLNYHAYWKQYLVQHFYRLQYLHCTSLEQLSDQLAHIFDIQ